MKEGVIKKERNVGIERDSSVDKVEDGCLDKRRGLKSSNGRKICESIANRLGMLFESGFSRHGGSINQRG